MSLERLRSQHMAGSVFVDFRPLKSELEPVTQLVIEKATAALVGLTRSSCRSVTARLTSTAAATSANCNNATPAAIAAGGAAAPVGAGGEGSGVDGAWPLARSDSSSGKGGTVADCASQNSSSTASTTSSSGDPMSATQPFLSSAPASPGEEQRAELLKEAVRVEESYRLLSGVFDVRLPSEEAVALDDMRAAMAATAAHQQQQQPGPGLGLGLGGRGEKERGTGVGISSTQALRALLGGGGGGSSAGGSGSGSPR